MLLPSGTLAIKVHGMDASFVEKEELVGKKLALKKDGAAIDENVKLSVKRETVDSKLTIEVLQERRKEALVGTAQLLTEFLKSNREQNMTFSFGPKGINTVLLYFRVNWEPSDTALTEKVDVHRPWLTRASYYYDTAKRNMVNTAVVKVSGMSLLEIDEAWVGPSLNVLDNKVDAGISKILTVLYSGRQYDVAVEMATKTKNFVTEKVSTAFSVGYTTIASVADYTRDTFIA
ncbi:hypothetical protein PHYSODRAFT_322712 [Phytophthora sojae]|uniref:Uncharacterized protein n=1 Tax=Phytophthora sojae (strain P6497) TaxID=1094619 RepID=G4YJ30_PHYSP|nr:hypothetical protein PHYSODRAFT_322712 [Phytophthora sojae]EGZ29170.1 hypothetical protein PHYSODRAFT_322712 [Phytophthora sojae]|eukprot:XP_009516445.1 hypothetical protein PHYSODRAFT_322712 [Phytophthora sojae]